MTLQRAVSRNDPCPCGSGRRYKDCHGSLRGAAATAAPPPVRKSRYRPAGNDWAEISEEECDRLGALMELALKHQLEGRVRDAERTYRAVLEQAPRTHDALHMLGVVRLGLGDFSDAQRLIKAAMALRPAYPAIEKNWSLVQRSIAARDRRGIEVLSEAALPLLFDAIDKSTAAHPRPQRVRQEQAPLHIVGVSNHAPAEAQWIEGRLAHLLASLDPELWNAREGAATGRWQSFDRHRLDPVSGRQPRSGDVIMIGVGDNADAWLRDGIERVLVFALSATPSLYLERLRRIAADGARSVALVFDSYAKARCFGRDDFVVPPPIDLDEYKEAPIGEQTRDSTKLCIATVGQDGRRIVMASDLPLFWALAVPMHEIWLLDPGPLRYEVGMMPAVRCIARDELAFPELLARVDLYLHRPLPWWTEDCGRAFFGAMTLGVPVLCPRNSMYAEYVEDGVDGWIYDDPASVSSLLDGLKNDRSRIAAAGRAARAKTLRLFDRRALTDAYLSVIRRWRAAG